MKKRLLALLLTLCMALTLVPAAAAAKPLLIAPNPNAAPTWLVPQVKEPSAFPDVTGTWCEPYVDTVYRSGLMSGKTDTKFDAVSDLTYAQITVICARLYELLTGGDGVIEAVPNTPWYQPSYDLLVEAGVLSHDYQYEGPFCWYPSAANDSCRRRVFVNLLGAVLEAADTSLPELNQVPQIPDYDNLSDHVYPFYRDGILNGADPYGGFHPESYLTRGAAAAMLSRIVNPQERLEFQLPSFDVCTDLLGVDHRAVLLVVDGTEITAEQMARDLAYWLPNTYTTPEALLENAIQNVVRDVAESRLAQELNLSFDREAYAMHKAEAERLAGFKGITLEGQLWGIQNTGYGSAFIYHFLPSHGEKGYLTAIDNAIEAKANTLTVERTELLNSLDLNTLHAKCKNSPYG